MKVRARIPGYLLLGIVLAGLFWILDAAILDYLDSERAFVDLLVDADREDVWIRWITVLLFVLFGALVDYLALQRRRADQALRQCLDFEGLVARLSTRFIDLPAAAVDREIGQALGEVGAFLAADRGFVVELGDGKTLLRLTHQWHRPEVPERSIEPILGREMPWVAKRLERDPYLFVHRRADLPPEAEAERELLDMQATRSLVLVPLRSEHRLVGLAGFEWVTREQMWSDALGALLPFASLVGEILVGTLDRKRAEVALRESERRFQLFSEAAFEGIVISRNGVIVDVSERFARIVGYEPEELLGMRLQQLIAEEYRELVTHRIESGYDKPYQTAAIHKDGHRVPIESCGRTVLDHGAYVRISAIRDITERMRAEAELRESEERFRTLVEYAPDAIMVRDPELARFVDCNQNAVELFGMSREELLKCGPLDLSPPEQPDGTPSRERIRSIDAEVRTGEGQAFSEHVFQRADGTEVPCEVRVVRLPWKDRFLVRGSIIDITERKRAERELRESEVRFRTLFENAPEAIVVLDAETGRFVDVNDNAEQLFKIERERLLEVGPIEVSPEQQPDGTLSAEAAREFIDRAMTGETPVFEWTHVDGHGREFPCEIRLVRLPFSGRHLVRGSITDVTARRQAEQALRDSERRFRDVTEAAHERIWETDDEFRFTFVSDAPGTPFFPAAREMLGKTPWGAVGADLDKDEDWRALKATLDKRLAFRDFRPMVSNPEGKLVCLRISGKAIFDDDAGFVGYRGVTSDETAEWEKERLIGLVLQSTGDAIFGIDKDGHLTFCNSACLQLLGYQDEGEVLGQEVDALINAAPVTGGARERFAAYRTLDTGVVVHVREARLSRADGTPFPAEYHAFPMWMGEAVGGAVVSLSDITERKQSDQALAAYQFRLRSLATELALAEERVRHSIAVDLHDLVGQSLSVSRMKLGTLRGNLQGRPETKLVDEIQSIIDRAVEESRSLVFQLSPPMLYELGFEPAVEWLVEEMSREHEIRGHIRDDNSHKPLSGDIRVALFQMVRELLLNVVKHARASEFAVVLARDVDRIRIEVQDDGIGFDIARLPPPSSGRGGFGLFSIRERLGSLGGEIEIDSEPGRGACIILKAPLAEEREAMTGS